MKTYTTLLLLLILLVGACTATPVEQFAVPRTLTALHGSSLAGVSLADRANAVSISAESVQSPGLFLELALDQRVTVEQEIWLGDGGLLHLIVPTERGVQIGIAPTSDYSGGGVSVELSFANGLRTASVPPVGQPNLISDLTVTDAGNGQVTLGWTQVNVGDYDFNGQVNIADLTPLAQHLNTTYNRDSPQAREKTEYWLDGDANGEINIADLTPIGANFDATIAGYNIRQNSVLIAGAGEGQPSVPASSGIERSELPPLYEITLDGTLVDNWKVTAVDGDGIEGADSSGGVGPTQLLSNITIGGLDLFDLDGTDPGGFDADKVVGRVIDPTEVVHDAELGDTDSLPTPGAFESRGLPLNKVVFLQFSFIPTIEIGTGAPKGGSGLRNVSVVEEDFVHTSIPLRIPDTEQPVDVEASIDLSIPNPAGGVFLDLTTTVTTPDPLGGAPLIETRAVRLDPANGLVTVDTDGNGDFADECGLSDSDGDCVSDNRREQEMDDDEYDDEDDKREDIKITAIVTTFFASEGLMTLSSIEVEEGILDVIEPFAVSFSELTEFEGTSGDIIPASDILPGSLVKVDLYQLTDGAGELMDAYWAEEVELEDED